MSRNTHQKQCILKVLQSMRGQHPTAETVYAEVTKEIPSISLATVYRILNQNAEQGMIGKVNIPGSPIRYDDLMEPHYHLLCNSCHRLLDMPHFQVQEIQVPHDDVSGHTITGVELIFRGICSECASRKK